MKKNTVMFSLFLLVTTALWIPAGEASADVNATCIVSRSISAASCVFSYLTCRSGGTPGPFCNPIFGLCISGAAIAFETCVVEPEEDPMAAYNECWNACNSDYEYCLNNSDPECDCIGAKLECSVSCMALFPDHLY